MTPFSGTLRVRMYCVGFGDCLLLSLRAVDGGVHHLLIDCGVHFRGDAGRLAEVVGNIRDETRGRLAVVVATHAHQDHLSGFAAHAATFGAMTVGEVWLPWIENPADPDARRLRQCQLALAGRLEHHFAATTVGWPLDAVRNILGNEDALRLLHGGIGTGRVRYLAAGQTLNDVGIKGGGMNGGSGGIDGLTVRVLGPPRDSAFLDEMDPPKADRFLRAGPDGVPVQESVRPFPDHWVVSADDLPEHLRLDDAFKTGLRQLGARPEVLAARLNQIVNNTSLVLLVSWRGQHLLFAGDAQYGPWRALLEQPDADMLLGQVTFFKVSHHGSGNATPRRLLDHLPKGGFVAMVSTQSTPWPSIPRQELMTAFERDAALLVRSDVPDLPPAVPAAGVGVSRGDFWFDYTA